MLNYWLLGTHIIIIISVQKENVQKAKAKERHGQNCTLFYIIQMQAGSIYLYHMQNKPNY